MLDGVADELPPPAANGPPVQLERFPPVPRRSEGVGQLVKRSRGQEVKRSRGQEVNNIPGIELNSPRMIASLA